MMADNCIFCKIAEGSLSASILYEDTRLMAIMDAFPATKGHVLIIPKAHATDIFDLPEETASAILPLAQQIARKIKEELQPAGINILQNNGKAAGQVVGHYHLHVIPRYEDDGMVIKHGNSCAMSKEEMAGVAEMLKHT